MNILDLSNEEAKKFFLEQKTYTTLDLPEYFDFSSVLFDLNKHLDGKVLSFSEIKKAKKIDSINYSIYNNKNNKYAWRKLELINPAIYVSMVNLITSKDDWSFIKNRFIELQLNKKIKCLSLPIIPENNQNQKASQIKEWVEEVEKESIRLALDFEYMFNTDISNCYSSIYTHTLPWALHTKEESKIKRNYDDLLGNKIDHHIQSMSNGQTNGIPQGSILMDFFAEIFLAFSDSELTKELEEIDSDFKILRYRDDYRIFVHNQKTGEEIIKKISFVLRNLGMSINSQKTCLNDDIIIKSIKPDKWYSKMHQAAVSVSSQNFLQELLIIYKISKLFPNCGSIQARLSNLYEKYTEDGSEHFIYESKEAISILINIAIECPKSFPFIAAFVGKAIKKMNKKNKEDTIDKIIKKIELLPNAGLIEVWIQRIAHPNSITNIPYKEKLCKLCVDNTIEIFNTSWITDFYIQGIIDLGSYILSPVFNNIDKEISKKQVMLFIRDEYQW